MSSRRRNQQRTLGRQLPLHFIQVGIRFSGAEQSIGSIRLDRCMPVEVRDGLQQMVNSCLLYTSDAADE